MGKFGRAVKMGKGEGAAVVHHNVSKGDDVALLLMDLGAGRAVQAKQNSPSISVRRSPVTKPRSRPKLMINYCRSCGTTDTPEWRKGPDGQKSLCNACGLHFAKMLKRERQLAPAEGSTHKLAIENLLC